MTIDIFIYVVLAINMAHMSLYIRFRTRSLPRIAAPHILMFLSLVLLFKLIGLFPFLQLPAYFGYVFYCMWLYRLVTDDSFNRLFLCSAFIMASSQLMRSPSVLTMIYVFDFSPEKMNAWLVVTYPLTFLLLLPFFLRVVRVRLMRVLDLAEGLPWYLVGLPPMILSIMGGIANFMITRAPHVEGTVNLGILTPVSISAYFVSAYMFLVSNNDRRILRQRLAAAHQLEHTYEFYNRELAEKESRLRTLRHDFRHRMIHLESLAIEGDMEGLRREIRETAKSEGGVAVTPFCENRTVNALVSYYFSIAEKSAVNCVAGAFVPERLPVSASDLSLVLGNALENCVKGASPLGETGYISFTAKPAKTYLMLTFANNYDKNRYLKGESAGLTSIRYICEQNHGRVEVSDRGNEFRLTVFLPMT